MITYTIKDNSKRAKQTGSLLWGLIFAGIMLMISAATLLTDAENSLLLSLYSLSVVGLFITMALSAIYFLRWLRRAYANITRAGLTTAYADGWAIGAWFVPFLNLVRPYTIVRETWRGTYLQAYEAVPEHGLLRWWWAIFIFNSIANNFISSMSSGYSPKQEMHNSLMGSLFSAPFLIVSTYLTLLVVRRIAAAEEQLLLRQQVAAIGGPAPEPTGYYPDDETLAY